MIGCKGQLWMTGFVLLLGVAVACAGLRICRKCGHENDQGAGVCTHCRASFPAPDPPETGDVDMAEPQDGYIPAAFVVAETVDGQKYFAAQKYELARLYFLNALALEGVTDPRDHESRTAHLLESLAAAEEGARRVRKSCPRCGGSGQHAVDFEGLQPLRGGTTMGSERAFTSGGTSGIRCRRCDGLGTVFAVGTVDDLKFARGAAMAEYRQYQQARRYEPLGGAWIPPQWLDRLSVRQEAAILRAIVLTCDACGGYGRSDCKQCGGLGRVECRNCTDGRVPTDIASDGVRRLGTDRTQDCAVCGGTGTIPCRRCNEEGTIVCKRCDGSGEAEECRSCGARGYVACRKCGGSKAYRGEPCPYCKGEGDTLCTSCKGRGRR